MKSFRLFAVLALTAVSMLIVSTSAEAGLFGRRKKSSNTNCCPTACNTCATPTCGTPCNTCAKPCNPCGTPCGTAVAVMPVQTTPVVMAGCGGCGTPCATPCSTPCMTGCTSGCGGCGTPCASVNTPRMGRRATRNATPVVMMTPACMPTIITTSAPALAVMPTKMPNPGDVKPAVATGTEPGAVKPANNETPAPAAVTPAPAAPITSTVVAGGCGGCAPVVECCPEAPAKKRGLFGRRR